MYKRFEQFLSLLKNNFFELYSLFEFAVKLEGLFGKENKSEGSSGFDVEVEPVDDFLLGKSLNFNNCSSSSLILISIWTFLGLKEKVESVFNDCWEFFSESSIYMLLYY